MYDTGTILIIYGYVSKNEVSVHPRCQLSYKALGEFVFVDNLASSFFCWDF